MTKATMPQPVAWQIHPADYGLGHKGVYARTDRAEQVEAWKRKGWAPVPLITTAQAEAYATTKVREALEAVESKLESMQTAALKERVPKSEDEGGWNTDCIARAFALSQAILEIRTLAPKDQSTPA